MLGFFIDTLSIPINSLPFGDFSAMGERNDFTQDLWQLLKTFTVSSLILPQTHENYFTPRRRAESNLEFSLKTLRLCNGEKTNSWSRCDVRKNESGFQLIGLSVCSSLTSVHFLIRCFHLTYAQQLIFFLFVARLASFFWHFSCWKCYISLSTLG